MRIDRELKIDSGNLSGGRAEARDIVKRFRTRVNELLFLKGTTGLVAVG
jgi:hypothetical protein